jgi:predicted GNAT superfamily acetyltransferase
VQLEPLTESDRAGVIALNERHQHLTAPMGPDRLDYLAGVGVVEVLRQQGRFAGFVVTVTGGADYDSSNFGWFRERYESFDYLDRIVVHEEFRRQGLGGLTYDLLEARTATRATVLALEVNSEPPNPVSMAFHAGRGYQQVGEREFDGHRVAMLVKSLVAAPSGQPDQPGQAVRRILPS